MAFPWAGQATLTDATPVVLHTARDTTTRTYITKITLSIVTHANGKFVSIRDTNASPVTYAKHIDATAAAGVPSLITWDFGKRGILITSGKNVDCVSEAGGVGGIVYCEGYDIGFE